MMIAPPAAASKSCRLTSSAGGSSSIVCSEPLSSSFPPCWSGSISSIGVSSIPITIAPDDTSCASSCPAAVSRLFSGASASCPPSGISGSGSAESCPVKPCSSACLSSSTRTEFTFSSKNACKASESPASSSICICTLTISSVISCCFFAHSFSCRFSR